MERVLDDGWLNSLIRDAAGDCELKWRGMAEKGREAS